MRRPPTVSRPREWTYDQRETVLRDAHEDRQRRQHLQVYLARPESPWIIENDWLEAIVALPLNMFSDPMAPCDKIPIRSHRTVTVSWLIGP